MALFRKRHKSQSHYDEIRLRIRESMRHGHLNMGSYSDDVDVKLWLPEMNGINVTIFLDWLFENYDVPQGFFILVTDKGDLDCLSLLNIEDQSSWLKLYERNSDGDQDILIMKVRSEDVKKELKIPIDCWSGFTWGNEQPNLPILWRGVSTEQYHSKYILNFSVSGEFDLEICYLPDADAEPRWVFKKSFYCK